MSTPAEILTAGGLTDADLIVQAASTTGLPLAILAAMIEKESPKHTYGGDVDGVYSPSWRSQAVAARQSADLDLLIFSPTFDPRLVNRLASSSLPLACSRSRPMRMSN